MCDACNSKGQDWKFINGDKKQLEKVVLYHVFKGKFSVLKLCHVHSIKLFQLGEMGFLRKEEKLCREISQNQQKYAKNAV